MTDNIIQESITLQLRNTSELNQLDHKEKLATKKLDILSKLIGDPKLQNLIDQIGTILDSTVENLTDKNPSLGKLEATGLGYKIIGKYIDTIDI